MTFRIIYDGIEQNSNYNRRTHQPPARRDNSGRIARARTRGYDPSPWQQYAYPHAALPPPPPAYFEPLLQWPLAYQENWGNAVYREAGNSLRPPRSRYSGRRGSDMGARHRSPGPRADRAGPESVHSLVFGTPAGRFLSELFHSFERLSHECPQVLQSSDPVRGGTIGARGERLLSVLNVASDHRGESAVLPADTTGGRGDSAPPHSISTPGLEPANAVPARRDDERGRNISTGQPVNALPTPHLCGKVHAEGDPCPGPSEVRYR
uniref:P3 n=1 Tax=Pastinaca umbravirus 1 TaxID=2950848 RepID=A0AB39IA26_9TOMB